MSKSTLPAHIIAGTTLPAHLATGKNTGNEEVTAKDLSIPRLKLLQKISPELEEGHERFMKDAKAGQFINTVTQTSHDELLVVNLHFSRGYSVFKKRALGGDFFGEFDSEAEATEALTAANENPAQYDIAENHRHMLLVLDENGNADMPAMMDFASTKVKTSKMWNSDISIKTDRNAPRFALVYRLKSNKQSNAKGSWFGVSTEFVGYASEELFAQAQQQYTSMFGE